MTIQKILLIAWLGLFLIFLKSVDAGMNKNISTQINHKTKSIYKQYKVNKSYLSKLIIVDACKRNNFTATQIAIVQTNRNSLKEIANEVFENPAKFLKELNESLEICDKKLKIIRNNAVRDVVVSFSIKHNMTIDQIKKAIKIKGVII